MVNSMSHASQKLTSDGSVLTDEPVAHAQQERRGEQDQGMRLLVVVGTDYHKFDRVISWVDEWVAGHEVEWAIMQHGASAAPVHAQGHSLIPHDQLQRLMSTASVIVTHGGPATIGEVRRYGLRPVVVPRDPQLAEHVDGHQQRFARRMGQESIVVLCETQDALNGALGAAAADPLALRLDTTGGGAADDPVAAAVARVANIFDDLVEAGRSRRRHRVKRLFSRPPS